mmetsp:Transcript_48811/g.100781  ORF Transcript_48811/g.100781 Transcript_48811/m.100781 type:complete len:178 (-) Transcript_48811:209-742(-)
MHKLEFTGSTLALAWHFGLVDPLLKSCRIFNLGPLKPKAAKKRQIIRFGRAVPTLTSQALRQDDSVNIHKRPMEMAFFVGSGFFLLTGSIGDPKGPGDVRLGKTTPGEKVKPFPFTGLPLPEPSGDKFATIHLLAFSAVSSGNGSRNVKGIAAGGWSSRLCSPVEGSAKTLVRSPPR